jgi:hypothetical protein
VGLIEIVLSRENEFAKIEIKDNGKGIPEEVLQRIGERGFSFGKKNSKSGSGLGFYSAREALEMHGGRLNILSKVNKGTSVILLIKAEEELAEDFYEFVYIEDDELLRMVWIEKAKKSGVRLLALSSSIELEKSLYKVDREKTQFYIDYELGEGHSNGVIVAEKLFNMGFKKLNIASGHSPEKFKDYSWLKCVSKKCPF